MASDRVSLSLKVQAALWECVDHVGMTISRFGGSIGKAGEALSRLSLDQWERVMQRIAVD